MSRRVLRSVPRWLSFTFYPQFQLYHQDKVLDVFRDLYMIGGVCLFVTFCPHFLEWCVFRAERQICRGVKWDVEKKTHKYTHLTINSRPLDNYDDVGDNDDRYNHVRVG